MLSSCTACWNFLLPVFHNEFAVFSKLLPNWEATWDGSFSASAGLRLSSRERGVCDLPSLIQDGASRCRRSLGSIRSPDGPLEAVRPCDFCRASAWACVRSQPTAPCTSVPDVVVRKAWRDLSAGNPMSTSSAIARSTSLEGIDDTSLSLWSRIGEAAGFGEGWR